MFYGVVEPNKFEQIGYKREARALFSTVKRNEADNLFNTLCQ